MQVINKFSLIVVLLFLLCFQGFTSESKKKILVINSYHQGLEWTDNVTLGIKEVFKDREDIEFTIEQLFSKEYPSKEYEIKLDSLFKYRYAKKKFDIILVSDNYALNFIIRNRKMFSESVSVIYCGINNFSKSLLKGQKNITGIAETTNHKSTLDVLYKLLPNTTKVYILLDKTLTGNLEYSRLKTITKGFFKDKKIEFVRDFRFSNIREYVANFEENSAVYLLTFNKDNDGVYKTYLESMKLIRESANVPVFGSWDFYFGRGIVGGSITSGFLQGKQAAQIAKKILFENASTDDFKTQLISPDNFMFDYDYLIKYNIDLSYIPDGSSVINQPLPLYQKYKKLIFILLILSIIIICLSIFYIVLEKRRKKILHNMNLDLDKKVKEKTKEYKELISEHQIIFDNTSVGIIYLKNMSEITKVNQFIIDLFEVDEEELLGDNSLIFKKISHPLLANKKILGKLKSGEVFRKVFKYVNSSGENMWLMFFVRAVNVDDLNEGIISIVSDVTESVNEEKLRENVERIMHHDLKTPLNAIISFNEYLKSNDKFNEEELEVMELIDSSAHQMLNMINTSLDIYKMEIGTFKYNPKHIDIIEILKLSKESLQSIANQNQISIIITINNEDLKNSDAIMIKSDQLLCQSMLSNLLKNAIEASPEKNRISINLEYDKNLIITMHNFGEVPDEVKNCFFDKFSTHDKERGTGLGTYSAKLIVETFGGKIKMESSKTAGTLITIKLPMSFGN